MQHAFLYGDRGRKTPLFQMSGESRGSLPLVQVGPFPEQILEVTKLQKAGGRGGG